MKMVVIFPVLSYAEGNKTEGSKTSNFLSINLGHLGAVFLISTSMSPNLSYIPIHVSYMHLISENFGLSTMIMIRFENDDTMHTTEFGFAIGPMYTISFLDNLYINCKVGLGFATGEDYYSQDYFRLDLILNPEIGMLSHYYLPVFNLSLGIAF